jgi:hypothetical protein
MDKGFVHDLAKTLPDRQEKAQAIYEEEARAFYAELEGKGINISSSNLPEFKGMTFVDCLIGSVRRYKPFKFPVVS